MYRYAWLLRSNYCNIANLNLYKYWQVTAICGILWYTTVLAVIYIQVPCVFLQNSSIVMPQNSCVNVTPNPYIACHYSTSPHEVEWLWIVLQYYAKPGNMSRNIQNTSVRQAKTMLLSSCGQRVGFPWNKAPGAKCCRICGQGHTAV